VRTYILALSKYPIALFMIAYAVISFLQVRKIGGDRGDERRTNALLVLLLFLVHAFGMLTIFVAMKDVRYLYFWLFQAVVFGFYIVLYRNLYPKANQTLCIHICMMLSIGLIIITRLSFSKAAKQFVIASAGMILTIAVPALMKKFHFMKKLTYVYALTGMAALSVVLLLGQVTQGSKLTWSVFGVTMQPSEFVKILFVFYLASAYYESAEWKDVLRAGIFCNAACPDPRSFQGPRQCADLLCGICFYDVSGVRKVAVSSDRCLCGGGRSSRRLSCFHTCTGPCAGLEGSVERH
jgi:cell division protein FtsW (lipid II flippase)